MRESVRARKKISAEKNFGVFDGFGRFWAFSDIFWRFRTFFGAFRRFRMFSDVFSYVQALVMCVDRPSDGHNKGLPQSLGLGGIFGGLGTGLVGPFSRTLDFPWVTPSWKIFLDGPTWTKRRGNRESS